MTIAEAYQDRVQTSGLDRTLMWAGVAVCPLFYALVLGQMATRPGFSIRVHPLSLLELGAFGWVQSLNFAACGVLTLLFAVGLVRRRELRVVSGLLLISGLGLLVVAAFPPDPCLGFPPGAPAGTPTVMSSSAKLHGLGFMLTFAPLTLACFVTAWTALRPRPRLAALSLAAGLLTPLVIAAGFAAQALTSIAFFVAGIFGLGWMSLLAAVLAASQRATGASAGGRNRPA